jgi:PEP-CTERM motif-containing protein
MRRIALLFLLAMSVRPGTSFAEPLTFTIHDFDDRPLGIQTFFESGLFLGTIAGGTVLDSIDIVPTPTFGSPPNAVRPAAPSGSLIGRFQFAETPHFTPAARVLFLDVLGFQPGDPPAHIELFDRAGRSLLEFTIPQSEGIGFVRHSPDIASFVFTPGVTSQVIDNLRHTGPVTPEPTTILLVGSGIAAALRTRRRLTTERQTTPQ